MRSGEKVGVDLCGKVVESKVLNRYRTCVTDLSTIFPSDIAEKVTREVTRRSKRCEQKQYGKLVVEKLRLLVV